MGAGRRGDEGSVKLREVADTIVIDPRKLTEYALNPEHEAGKHKARVFESALGYNPTNFHLLLDQIMALALDAEMELMQINERGQFFRADLLIDGLAGQQVTVRTGWRLPPSSREARLTTLFVP